MKNKILLSVLIIFLVLALTGCGAFNLNGWVWPEDDLEFMAMVEELDTPQKISEYLIENDFEYEAHLIYAPDPYTLWKTKRGDCNDFSTFGVFIAHWHGYETYQIEIYYSGTIYKHWIAVYVEDVGLSYTDLQYYIVYDYLKDIYGFKSFKEIVDFACIHYPGWELEDYIVYDYENRIVERGSDGYYWIIPGS